MKRTIQILFIVFSLLNLTQLYAQSDTTASIWVNGVCGQCEQRIEKALKIKGVSTAKWDIPSQQLTVTYDPSRLSLNDIHQKMADIGHDTELKKAKDDVYQALPDCCHYRELEGETHSDDLVIPQENQLSGVVVTEDKKGVFSPLTGASIVWLNEEGGTKTDAHGVFSLPYEKPGKLLISYAGLKADTVNIENNTSVQIVMVEKGEMNEIRVVARPKPTYINTRNPFRVANISSRELLKAACCNLSESFETNPSVDVSYSDAVTGSKQIQLLGLAGNYSQLTMENMPGPRGLATPLGLNSIAGPWVESIQLSKGTGSVVNGFESISGQINVELRKPENMDRVYANGYLNTMGKSDFNLNLAQKLNNKWSTALLLHDDFLYNKTDFNKDGFRDLPTGNQFSAVNRWKFDNGTGLMFQLAAKVLLDDKTGGELDYEKTDKLTTNHYGLGINTERYEAWAKIGYVFPEMKYKSIGLQLSAFQHKQDAYFGLTTYNAKQNNIYGNLIFQNIIGNTAHKFRTGLSFSADKYDELYKDLDFKRQEIVPGAYFEYTFSPSDNFNVVAGIRGDHNSLFGWFATPRLNVRYEPVSGTTIRLSAGRGQRTANIFAENMSTLVSARQLNILSASAGKAYGLDPEVAWNKGITIDQKFRLFQREAMLSVDYFRNDFNNQVVVDMEDPRQVKFYNLDGKSFSNSFQTELTLMPIRNMDLRLAYRWFDVKTTYGNALLQKPFTASNRAFANVGYELDGWKFDYTVNYVGSKRIPSTAGNDPMHRLPLSSPSFTTMNAQVSKAFGKDKDFELYLGGENLTNYFQQNAIISAEAPFGPQFDASMIWGPVGGRQFYTGFRYTIK
ncbi:MAG: TonB-dependent receptor domain-containing protein [Flavisolibacter sp.]